MPTGLNVIGPRVRRLRDAAGYTQEQLVARLHRAGWDISRVALGMLESGRRGVQDYEVLVLARVLRVATDELFAKGTKIPVRKLRNPGGPKERRTNVNPSVQASGPKDLV